MKTEVTNTDSGVAHPTVFLVSRGGFEFKVVVNNKRMKRGNRDVSPFVTAELIGYTGDDPVVVTALYDYIMGHKNLIKGSYLHPNDGFFSVSFGLNLALDRVTREIAGIVKVFIRRLVANSDNTIQNLARATARSKKRFVKRFTDEDAIAKRTAKYGTPDPEGIKEILGIINVEPVEGLNIEVVDK